ncbi:hypothetical protein [Schaalia vaccimaxillae]|uniref:hypothetical protein n=1 Tax=Schaalia vaccimaxillae TaxID=183916 RepID=UPI00040FEB04|nr:hypothetical protein [Schaalia vaccimaxillae]
MRSIFHRLRWGRPRHASALAFPIPSIFNQASFPPGSCFVAVLDDHSVAALPWPKTHAGDRVLSDEVFMPMQAIQAAVLTTAVLIDKTWLVASFHKGASPESSTWTIWPLEDWAGAARTLSTSECASLGLPIQQTSVPTPLVIKASRQGIFPRISAARIRVTTGNPWAMCRPTISVEPDNPWSNLDSNWTWLLRALGIDNSPQMEVEAGLQANALIFRRSWEPLLASARAAQATRHGTLPGWGPDSSSWIESVVGSPRIPHTVASSLPWGLCQDGTLRPLSARIIHPDARPAPVGPHPDLAAACWVHLIVRKGKRAFCAESFNPDQYCVLPQTFQVQMPDGSMTKADEPCSAEMDAWGFSYHRTRDTCQANMPRSQVDEVYARVVGIGPSEGRTRITQLPAGSDISRIMSDSSKLRAALVDLLEP